MAYQRAGFQPDHFTRHRPTFVNPLEAGFSGLNMLQQAQAAEMDRQAKMADILLRRQQADTYAQQVAAQQAGVDRADRMERGKAVQAAQAAFAAGDKSGGLNILRAAGIQLGGQEDVYGQAPMTQQRRPGPSIDDVTAAADQFQPATPKHRFDVGPDGNLFMVQPPEPPAHQPATDPRAGFDYDMVQGQRPVIGQRYDLRGPGDERYSIDTSERGRFQDQQRARALADIDSIDPAKLHPDIAALMPTIREGIKANIIPPGKSMEEMIDWAAKIRASNDRAEARDEADERWRQGHALRQFTANRLFATAPGAPPANLVLGLGGEDFGFAPGTARESDEGAKTAKMYAAIGPIKSAVDRLRDEVGQTGIIDRLPIVGKYTPAQQRIRGKVDNLIAPLTQFLGSGVPGDSEAARKIDAFRVSAAQGAEISHANLDELLRFVNEAYQSAAVAATRGRGGKNPVQQGVDKYKANQADLSRKLRTGGKGDALDQDLGGM